MKFSGKIWLIVISKVTKSQGFTLASGDAFLEKPEVGGGRGLSPSTLFKVKNMSGPTVGKSLKGITSII